MCEVGIIESFRWKWCCDYSTY